MARFGTKFFKVRLARARNLTEDELCEARAELRKIQQWRKQPENISKHGLKDLGPGAVALEYLADTYGVDAEKPHSKVVDKIWDIAGEKNTAEEMATALGKMTELR